MSKRRLPDADATPIVVVDLLCTALPGEVLDLIARALIPDGANNSRGDMVALSHLALCSRVLRKHCTPLIPPVKRNFQKHWCYLCRTRRAWHKLGCTGTDGCVLQRHGDEEEDEEEEEDSSHSDPWEWDTHVICGVCRKTTCAACNRGYCGCVPLVEECQVCYGSVCARCVDNCDLFDYEQMCCYACRDDSGNDSYDEEDDDDDDDEDDDDV